MDDTLPEPAKEYARCRHFNGIQHDGCKAGISYNSVRDPTRPFRWPCLTLIGRPAARTPCTNYSPLTREELDAENREWEAVAKRACDAIEAGKCHVCGGSIEPSQVVGRCRYASCGHRVGQVLSEEE